MIAAQTATLGGAALVPLQFGGSPAYTAPAVDLRGRETVQDDGIWVVIFAVSALAYAYAAFQATQGNVCDVEQGFKWGFPYWKVTCRPG